MSAITMALRQYERKNGPKKAALLTQSGSYYLYDNRFCTISDFELLVIEKDFHIQGGTVPCDLLLGMAEDTPLWSVKDTGEFHPDHLSLIFHIELGEGELLRGILLARKRKVRYALFCDAAIEELYRLSCQAGTDSSSCIPPDDLLQKRADGLRHNDLHCLTKLYLCGKRLSDMRK